MTKDTAKRSLLTAVLTLVCLIPLPAVAGNSDAKSPPRFEARLGIGDMFFETIIWHDQIHKSYNSAPDGVLFPEDTHFHYSPHFSASCSYDVFKWMSVGLMLDFQRTSWTRDFYDNKNDSVKKTKENFYNFAVLPAIRFNWLIREHWGLYSAIAGGIDFNGGSEKDGFGRNTATAFSADLRLVGVRAGSGRWWGYAEFGGLAALQNGNIIYMLGSELVRAGVAFRF